MTSKADVRQMMRHRRPFAADLRARKSAEICAAIMADADWRAAHTIAIFAPTPAEPDVELLWAHAAGRTLCYPRVRERELDLIRVTDPAALTISRWQLREPPFDPAELIDLRVIDLVLVPGVAFTRGGERLGRGGGFYDRLLGDTRLRAVKVGVCFEVQLVSELPLEPHDAQVDRVIWA